MTKRTDSPDEDYLTPSEAAKVLHVSTRTLARLAERGEIATYVLPSGHRRYLRGSVEKIKAAA